MNIANVTNGNGVAFFSVIGIFRTNDLRIFGTIAGIIVDFFPLIMPLLVVVIFIYQVAGISAYLRKLGWLFQKILDDESVESETVDAGMKIVRAERLLAFNNKTKAVATAQVK